MKKLLLSVIFILCISAAASARTETGVFPYRTANPSEDLPESSGQEYARMLTVILSLATDTGTVSQREMLAETGQLGLSPSVLLTGQDLNMLAERISADRILAGTVSRSGGKFMSESVLYSVKDGRVIQNASVTADSMEKLAEKEIREYFPLEFIQQSAYPASMTDTVFLVDCSFSTAGDWDSVKQGVLTAGERLFSGGRNSARICLVPFGDRTESPAVRALNSENLSELKKNLSSLRPSGTCSDSSFKKSIEYAVKSFLWRKDAEKKIIIITNSVIGRQAAGSCGMTAGRAGIKTDSVLLGKLNFEKAQVFEALSEETGGTVRYAAYHKKIFDINGRSRELYLQQGRLFCSSELLNWKKGILNRTQDRTGFMASGDGLTEIITGSRQPEPDTMEKCWTAVSGERTLNSRETENNASLAIGSCTDMHSATEAGRILVYDGELSIWVSLADPESAGFFQRKKTSGEYLELGVSVYGDSSSPYGIVPVCTSSGLNSDDIPSACRVRIKDLIKKKDESGLMNPPVWFLRVKIQEVRGADRTMDIRNSMNY